MERDSVTAFSRVDWSVEIRRENAADVIGTKPAVQVLMKKAKQEYVKRNVSRNRENSKNGEECENLGGVMV